MTSPVDPDGSIEFHAMQTVMRHGLDPDGHIEMATIVMKVNGGLSIRFGETVVEAPPTLRAGLLMTIGNYMQATAPAILADAATALGDQS